MFAGLPLLLLPCPHVYALWPASRNYARRAGAIFAATTTANRIAGCEFTNNTAYSGACFGFAEGTWQVNTTSFNGNTAEGGGSVFFADGAAISQNGLTFGHNPALFDEVEFLGLLQAVFFASVSHALCAGVCCVALRTLPCLRPRRVCPSPRSPPANRLQAARSALFTRSRFWTRMAAWSRPPPRRSRSLSTTTVSAARCSLPWHSPCPINVLCAAVDKSQRRLSLTGPLLVDAVNGVASFGVNATGQAANGNLVQNGASTQPGESPFEILFTAQVCALNRCVVG